MSENINENILAKLEDEYLKTKEEINKIETDENNEKNIEKLKILNEKLSNILNEYLKFKQLEDNKNIEEIKIKQEEKSRKSNLVFKILGCVGKVCEFAVITGLAAYSFDFDKENTMTSTFGKTIVSNTITKKIFNK
jgi:acyl-CoA reductase-like NAD-dependent aldehyde dehydrogenase